MNSCLVGVISDTHGLIRPQALRALADCTQIIHAGDVGKIKVLDELRRIGPTTAVRGNVDKEDWAQTLPPSETLSVFGVTIYILHDLHTLDINPAAAGVRVVISGHSHQPRTEEKSGVLYLNPGAAGPRRFRLPVTVAHLEISANGQVRATLIDLLDP